VQNAVVYVQDGKIAGFGSNSVPQNIRTIDLGDTTLLPLN